MRTRIISAFPGVGKTHYHKQHTDITLDSDSSNFSWVVVDGKKVRNPDFPNNYIQHIKDNIGKYKFIFVSSHKEVREALKDACLFFYLVYPDKHRKDEFINRYKQRGSPEAFVNLVYQNWEQWIRECQHEEVGCKQIRMILKNLEDELNHIEASEYGEE